ncbi:hypothetical protein [Microcoleus sp.]|uniref:hypothetical protein n=1 Tax=Microcoleus sp. TaxID=44472 RepID=UPI003526296B
MQSLGLSLSIYSLSQLGEVLGNGASGIGHRASGITNYQLLITYYQFSIVPHLSEKGYSLVLNKPEYLSNIA